MAYKLELGFDVHSASLTVHINSSSSHRAARPSASHIVFVVYSSSPTAMLHGLEQSDPSRCPAHAPSYVLYLAARRLRIACSISHAHPRLPQPLPATWTHAPSSPPNFSYPAVLARRAPPPGARPVLAPQRTPPQAASKFRAGLSSNVVDPCSQPRPLRLPSHPCRSVV